jgi:hypothetical protein
MHTESIGIEAAKIKTGIIIDTLAGSNSRPSTFLESMRQLALRCMKWIQVRV